MENGLFRLVFGRQAPGSARRDDPRLEVMGLADDDGPDAEPDMDVDDNAVPLHVRDIGPLGIREDEVALPGNGAAAIDDLEERGELTPDLLRKARPDVWRVGGR